MPLTLRPDPFLRGILEGDQDGRTPVPLRNAGGYDTDHAVMPGFIAQDDHGILFKIVFAVDAGVGLLDDFIFFILPLPIDIAQAVGQLLRRLCVRCQKQIHRHGGISQPAGGIDAGGNGKTNQRGCDFLLRVGFGLTGDGVQKCMHARPGRCLNQTKSQCHDQTVFVDDRHHIGDGSQRHQIPVLHGHTADALAQFVLGMGQGFHGTQEFEHHAHARHLLEGIGIVGAMGIDHRSGIGQLLAALVVIGDDQGYAQLAGIRGFRHCRNAGIHGNHGPHTVLRQRIQCGFGHAVSLAGTAGNIVAHIRAQLLQIQIQTANRGNSIHVIIAVHGDFFAVCHRIQKNRCGFLHIHQIKGVVKQLRLL